MNKIKVRIMGLIFLALVLISIVVVAIFLQIKIKNFHTKINDANYQFTLSLQKIKLVFNNTNSVFAPIIPVGIFSIFLIFAFIYAYAKNNSSKIIRKWPYIVMSILITLWGFYILYIAYTKNLKNTVPMDSQIPLNIQEEINSIYKTKYYSSVKLLTLINLVIIWIGFFISNYLLILTIQIKNLSDINYSKKVSEFKKEVNDLP